MHDSVVVYDRNDDDALMAAVAARLRAAGARRIAINSGGSEHVTDGMSYAQRVALERALFYGLDAFRVREVVPQWEEVSEP